MRNDKTQQMMNSTIYFMLNNAPQDLLTFDDELRLGGIIQAGVSAQEELDSGNEMSDDRKAELKAATEKVKEAVDDLVTHNIKLVVSVAKKYDGYRIPLEDLVQEGLIGCTKAAYKYNPLLNFRFSTCAVPWIKQNIMRYIQEQRTIRMPAHVHEGLSRINKITEEYMDSHNGEVPTDEQIVMLSEGKLTLENVQLYKTSAQPIASLNAIVGDEDDTELHELIADEGDESPVEYTEKQMLRDNLEDLISTLPGIQGQIIKLRFGLNDEGREFTLEEVGERLGYTRERIRQMESDALITLKVRASKDSRFDDNKN